MKIILLGNVDVRKLIREAYNLSSPQGLGFLHNYEGELSEREIDDIAKRAKEFGRPVSMDYVRGRSIKLRIYRTKDGREYIYDRWYDHSDEQLRELLRRVDVPYELTEETE